MFGTGNSRSNLMVWGSLSQQKEADKVLQCSIQASSPQILSLFGFASESVQPKTLDRETATRSLQCANKYATKLNIRQCAKKCGREIVIEANPSTGCGFDCLDKFNIPVTESEKCGVKKSSLCYKCLEDCYGGASVTSSQTSSEGGSESESESETSSEGGSESNGTGRSLAGISLLFALISSGSFNFHQ